VSISRRLRSKGDRSLQNTTIDPLFIAGQSIVNIPTPVLYQAKTAEDPCYFKTEFTEWWVEEDIKDRYKYIGILVFTGGAIAL
jgi:hypothetical protein